jgi:nucleoside-triphosphatase THEP1
MDRNKAEIFDMNKNLITTVDKNDSEDIAKKLSKEQPVMVVTYETNKTTNS